MPATTSHNYEDLEQLIFRGFLLAPTVMAPNSAIKVPILFKSLTEYEYDLIQSRYYYVDQASEKFRYFVAYSIAEIEGKNVLPVRDELLDDLIDTIKQWPTVFFDEVAALLEYFKDRMQKALHHLEVYCYSEVSRAKWSCYKGLFLNDYRVTGWRGTESITLSSTQQTWIMMNSVEDSRIRYEMLNDAARLIATATNFEGMKKLNAAEERRREEIKEYRESLKAPLVIEEADGELYRSETLKPEQLVAQLQRMQRGDEDKHDKIVTEYEREVKKMFYAEKKKQSAILAAKLKDKPLPMQDISSEPSRMVTREDIEKAKAAALNADTEGETSLLRMDEGTKKKLSLMAALEDEEEESFVTHDPSIDRLGAPANPYTSNSSWGAKNNVIKSPVFEDYEAQQRAWRDEAGISEEQYNPRRSST